MQCKAPITRSKDRASQALPDAAAKALSTGRKVASKSARRSSDDADDTTVAGDVAQASTRSKAAAINDTEHLAPVMPKAAATQARIASSSQQDAPTTSTNQDSVYSTPAAAAADAVDTVTEHGSQSHADNHSSSSSSNSPSAKPIKASSSAAASAINPGDADNTSSKEAETEQAILQEDEASAAAEQEDKQAAAEGEEEGADTSEEDSWGPDPGWRSSSHLHRRRYSSGGKSSESYDVDDYDSSADEASEEGEGMWAAWLRCPKNREAWGC